MRLALKLPAAMTGENALSNLLRVIWNVGHASAETATRVKNARRRTIPRKLVSSARQTLAYL